MWTSWLARTGCCQQMWFTKIWDCLWSTRSSALACATRRRSSRSRTMWMCWRWLRRQSQGRCTWALWESAIWVCWRKRPASASRYRPTSWSTTRRWCGRRLCGSCPDRDRCIMYTTVSAILRMSPVRLPIWCRRQMWRMHMARWRSMSLRRLCFSLSMGRLMCWWRRRS